MECSAVDFSINCSGACSNDSPGLGKYALCQSSDVCGESDLYFTDYKPKNIEAKFTSKDQLCVYRFHLDERFMGLQLQVSFDAFRFTKGELYTRTINRNRNEFNLTDTIKKLGSYHPELDYYLHEDDTEYTVIFVATPLDDMATFRAVVEYESAMALNVMKQAGEPS